LGAAVAANELVGFTSATKQLGTLVTEFEQNRWVDIDYPLDPRCSVHLLNLATAPTRASLGGSLNLIRGLVPMARGAFGSPTPLKLVLSNPRALSKGD
jgi:hypothetical protein